MKTEIAGSVTRTVLIAVSSILATLGVVQADDAAVITKQSDIVLGAAGVIIGQIWSIIQKYKAKKNAQTNS